MHPSSIVGMQLNGSAASLNVIQFSPLACIHQLALVKDEISQSIYMVLGTIKIQKSLMLIV